MVGGNFALPHCQDILVDEYQSTAATFDPKHFDAREWARLAQATAAREYAVLTAKHHDGYAMFHTQLSDFSVQHSPFGRDIVREWVDAFRAEGLRVGALLLADRLASSRTTRRSPTTYRPYNFLGLPKPTPEQWARYLEFMFGQVRELLTNYGDDRPHLVRRPVGAHARTSGAPPSSRR